jgi:hypothetical protein
MFNTEGLRLKVAKKWGLCDNVRPRKGGKKLSARRDLSNLAQLERRLTESQRERAIAQEQVSIQSEQVRDSGFKMLLADTPGASLIYRKAGAALARAQRDLDEAIAVVDQLIREREDLQRKIPQPISSIG